MSSSRQAVKGPVHSASRADRASPSTKALLLSSSPSTLGYFPTLCSFSPSPRLPHQHVSFLNYSFRHSPLLRYTSTKNPNCFATSVRARRRACERLGALRPPRRLLRLTNSITDQKVLATSHHVKMTSREQLLLLQTIKAMKEKIARDTIGKRTSSATPTSGAGLR